MRADYPDEPILSESSNHSALFDSSTTSPVILDASVSTITDNSSSFMTASADGSSVYGAVVTNTSNNADQSLNDAFIEDLSAPLEIDEPGLSSSLPYWAGDTAECGHCQRRVLKKFYDVHLSNCRPPTPVNLSTSTTMPGVSSVNNSSFSTTA